MPHLEDHAARFRRVRQLHGVTDPAQPHSLHGNPLGLVEANRAADERHLQHLDPGSLLFLSSFRCALLRGGHDYPPTSSANSLPRYLATSDGSFSSMSPL